MHFPWLHLYPRLSGRGQREKKRAIGICPSSWGCSSSGQKEGFTSLRGLGIYPVSTSAVAGLPGVGENRIFKKARNFLPLFLNLWSPLFWSLDHKARSWSSFCPHLVCTFVFQADFESRPGSIWGGRMGNSLWFWWSFKVWSLSQCAHYQSSQKAAPNILSRVYTCSQWGDRVSVLAQNYNSKIFIF